MAKLKLYAVSADGRNDLAVVTASKVRALQLMNESARSYISAGTFSQYGRIREGDRLAKGDDQVWAQAPETVMIKPIAATDWVPAHVLVTPRHSSKGGT